MKKKNESGQALVEFVLTTVLLLLLFSGVVDFGFLLSTKIQAENAAEEGARIGIREDSSADAITTARSTANDYCELMTSDSTKATEATVADGKLTVTVTCDYKPMSPMGKVLFPSGVKTIRASCTMLLQQ